VEFLHGSLPLIGFGVCGFFLLGFQMFPFVGVVCGFISYPSKWFFHPLAGLLLPITKRLLRDFSLKFFLISVIKVVP